MSSESSNDASNQQLINLEIQRIQLYQDRLALDREQQERNHEINILSVNANIELNSKQPSENRKDFIYVAITGIVLLIIIMAFFLISMKLGYSDLVYQILTYGGTALVSFFGGKYYEKGKSS